MGPNQLNPSKEGASSALRSHAVQAGGHTSQFAVQVAGSRFRGGPELEATLLQLRPETNTPHVQ